MLCPTPESQLRKLSEDGPISYGNNESDMDVKKKGREIQKSREKVDTETHTFGR